MVRRKEAPLEIYQPRLEAVAVTIAGLDIREFELADAATISADLRSRALEILSDARDLLARLLEAADQLSRPAEHTGADSVRDSYLPFDQVLDSSVERSSGDVAAIAFIAHLELNQRLERLERATPARGSAQLLAECDGALRRARRALSAVDAAIAAAAGVEPRLAHTSVLESSLAVRRAYAKFRRSLLGDDPSAPRDLRKRFRAAGTQIAIVIGWSVYPEMRVGDRLLLRGLQTRILAWLRDAESSPVDGARLWQDLCGFLEMLSLVNKRQELVEHDRTAVMSLSERLEDRGPDVDVSGLLSNLAGLDDELDGLAATEPVDLHRLRGIVDRLRQRYLAGGRF